MLLVDVRNVKLRGLGKIVKINAVMLDYECKFIDAISAILPIIIEYRKAEHWLGT